MRPDGALTFWKLADRYDRYEIEEGMRQMQFDKLVPKKPAPATILHHAMRHAFKQGDIGYNWLVRVLGTPGSYSLVKEVIGDDGNQYENILTAKIADGLKLQITPFDYDLGNRIIKAYEEFTGYMMKNQVSNLLVSIANALNCTTLRPSGGIYWSPYSAIDAWKSVSTILHRAGSSPSNIYLIRHEFDCDSIRAIKDALIAEVTAKNAAIEEAIISGDMGARALRTKEMEADAVLAKIKSYEDILGESLQDVLKAAEDCREQAALLALEASSKSRRAEEVGV